MGYEKRDLGLKFGVAFALSVGGILCSLIINKRIKHSNSKSTPHPRKRSDSNNNQMNSRSNHQSSQTTANSLQIDPLAKDKHEDLHHSNSHVPDLSTNTISNGDNELVTKANISSKKDTELVRQDIGSPKGCSCADEQEIKSLRNTVKVLKERERNLEIKLLEYYGLKEQETAVMELQNRLKLNNMEAKLFTLQIESLQADNRRLQAQMTDHTKIVTDLESSRAKIKALKKKLRSEAEHHKKQILDFQQRVQKVQDNEQNHVVGVDSEIESSLLKMKDFETEVEDLRKSNRDLQIENSDLAHRLDCVQILAASVLEDGETEKLKEENQKLKKQNEDLSKEIERLQGDRCTDVEEVVYLRWINACLRHELRNYQPGPGKTTARDLSKTLSPKSEEKAKQLILDYANKEGGIGDKSINFSEIDSDQWSSSQASIITDPGDIDESYIDDPPQTHKNHHKFFGKLIRFLRGKDSPNHHHHNNRNHSRNSSLGRSEFGGEDMVSLCSSENHRLRIGSPVGSSKHSATPKRLTHRHSTDACFYNQKISDTIADGGRSHRSSSGGGRSFSASLYGQKSDVTKYAEALKGTRSTSNFKCHRSSPSLGYN